MPKLAILLLSYNRPEGLSRAILSVLAQTYQDYCCYILDDYSTHPGVHELLEDAAKESRFKVHVGPPYSAKYKQTSICSAGELFNWGIKNTTTDFVTYLTDSSAYTPDRCSRMVHYLSRATGTKAMWGHQNMVWYNAEGVVLNRRNHRNEPDKKEIKQGYQFEQQLEQGNFIDTSSVMERRNKIQWSVKPEHWPNMDHIRWKKMAALRYRFDFIPVVGETKHSSPLNMGCMLATGADMMKISESVR